MPATHRIRSAFLLAALLPPLQQTPPQTPFAGPARQTWQLPANPATVKPIPVKGSLTVVANLTVSSVLPDGTTIGATAFAGVSDPSFSGENSVSGGATVAGGKASFRLVLPYNWLVSSTAGKIFIEVDITGNYPNQKNFLQFTDTTYLHATIAIPKNGTATVTFNSGL